MFGACRFGGLMLMTVAFAAAETLAQTPRSNSKTIVWQSPQSTNDIQIGILGEIARPGVYQLDPEGLSVQALVRKAGGLTEEASLSIRIIRQERVAQSLFFSPSADSRLLPGDVLVVESKRALDEVSKVMEASSQNPDRQTTSTDSDPTGVQVAFLNVLDTPVIVKLHSDDARVDHVVQMLGQPIGLASSVKVLSPQRSSTVTPERAATIPRLADGAVLVFPKGAINRRKLPTFPKPYGSEIANGAATTLNGQPVVPSEELRDVGRMAPLMTLPGSEATPLPGRLPESVSSAPDAIPFPKAEEPIAPPPLDDIPPERSNPLADSRPRIATIPFTGAPSMRSLSSRSPSGTESTGQPRPKQADTGEEKVLAPEKSLKPESARSAGSSTDSRGATPFTLPQMLGIFSGVCGLIGLAMLARKHFDRQFANTGARMPEVDRISNSVVSRGGNDSSATRNEQEVVQENASLKPSEPSDHSAAMETSPDGNLDSAPQVTTEPSEETPVRLETQPVPYSNVAAPVEATPGRSHAQDSRLDRLIRNDFSFREESIEFPRDVVLQGRIAPRAIHRLDAADGPVWSRPHIKMSGKQSEAPIQETSEQSLEAHSASDPQLAGPHFGRSRRSVKAPIEREPKPSEASSALPLTEALRHLERGRRL